MADAHQNRKENRTADRTAQRVVELLRGTMPPASGDDPAQQAEVVSGSQIKQFIRFMRFSRRVTASAILAAALGAIYEFLTLMGVADVSPARVVLFGAWFFATLFVSELLLQGNWKLKVKLWVGFAAAVALAGGAFWLNHYAVHWRETHPGDPEIHQIKETVTGIKNDIAQFRGQTTPTQVQHPEPPPPAGGVAKPVKPPQQSNAPPTRGYLAEDTVIYKGTLDVSPGSAAVFNVSFRNDGGAYVHDADSFAALIVVGVRDLATVNAEVRAEFARTMRPLTKKEDLAPGDSLWGTVSSEPFTPQIAQGILSEDVRVYIVGRAQWTADGVPDHLDRCIWMQPPPQGTTVITQEHLVWQIC
jgi:hypothetical protein